MFHELSNSGTAITAKQAWHPRDTVTVICGAAVGMALMLAFTVGKDVDMSYQPLPEEHIHSLLDEAVTFLLQAQASACNAADEAYEGQTEMENLTRELRNVIHSAITVRDKWSPLYRENIACLRDEAADMEREMREHGDFD